MTQGTPQNESLVKVRSKSWRAFIASVVAGACIFSLAACGDNTPSSALAYDSTHNTWASEKLTPLTGEFAASGASSQKSAVDAWIVGYSSAQPHISISYDPSGSGAGVNAFLTGAVSWAGTDAPLSQAQLQASQAVCNGDNAFEIPTYVSPIALAYNLSEYGLNGNAIQLSATTIAKIFNGSITMWDDNDIRQENPEIASKLPHIEITPVWRLDKSGTTRTFQTYLHQAAGDEWSSEPSETWPNSIGQGAKGTPGVVMTIGQAQGTIGYADYAQTSGLGTVAVKVGDYYVDPTPDATAELIANSTWNKDAHKQGRYVLDVDYATQSEGVYPIALVSYDVACRVYPDKRDATFVKQWLSYVLSDAGQIIAQDNAGAAPLPKALRNQMLRTVKTITSASDSKSSSGSEAKGRSDKASQHSTNVQVR
ncbi:phosphate ABC transporter substrate-binding protein PstS [Alloscardovia theropitheci]|uniref:Phosphate-binding protein n=1 Tax=Alloscardovia theropitheci TaxID=2496842 RepID=A0A4R0R0E4_9BIFI|nr:phosphate ABC transporter substrate-binding protein PstS [Alloscardovia theropitheci]TCD54496.1 phosphate ABC transporter substrate-binding protein PstS [Alloscardovia theropitheci]